MITHHCKEGETHEKSSLDDEFGNFEELKIYTRSDHMEQIYMDINPVFLLKESKLDEFL